MNIETVRAFLHAHDPSSVWDILKWLDEQNRAPLGQWDDAYEYFRGALTADMRAAAIETIMAECWAETERIVSVVNGHFEYYGAVEFRSWDGNHSRYWTSIRGPKGPRLPRSVYISDAHTLAALPIAIKRDLGDALAAEAKRRFAAPRTGVDTLGGYDWQRGNDRRRTIETRIEHLGRVAASGFATPDWFAAQADFQRWAANQYARLCLGFLIGPARR